MSSATVASTGHVEDVKLFGPIAFITLRVLSDFENIGLKYQFVIRDPSHLKAVKTISRQSYVYVQGVLQKTQLSNKPSYLCTKLEVQCAASEVWGDSLSKPKSRGLVEFDTLECRREEYHWIFLARDIMYKAIRKSMKESNFIEITTPKLIEGTSEGGSQLFSVVHSSPLFLSQSPQLYKQGAINLGLKKVYEIGAIYRAEKFKTSRHLNETTCWDLEMQTNSLEKVIEVVRDTLIEVSVQLNSRMSRPPSVIRKEDFKVMTYSEVVRLLGLNYGEELTRPREKLLMEKVGTRYVFVRGYPISQKPFYIHKGENFDLIGHKGELCSGGLRENIYDVLLNQVKERNIDPSTLEWYLKMFKTGVPQTGGMGLGLDRLLSDLLDLPNIRDTKIFPFI